MKSRSGKNKGKRCANEARDMILQFFGDHGPNHIVSNIVCAQGEDISLSDKVEKILPVVIECKNTEKLNIWKALTQAESHHEKRTKGGGRKLTPLLVFKRNRSKLYCAIPLEDFLQFATFARWYRLMTKGE